LHIRRSAYIPSPLRIHSGVHIFADAPSSTEHLVSFPDGAQPRKGTHMSKLDDLITEVSVTRRLVSIATDRAGLTALVGGPGANGQPRGGSHSYASLATTVQAAAAGLTWRGLRPRDVVGVLVPDVVGFTLAVHAVRAAGGVPSPVDVNLCTVETAGQLAESGARMVITAPPLADTALAAVDRSWVRQVFSFVDAPGATRFSDLLGLDMIRPSRGRPDDVALLPFSRGLDGRLRPAPVTHRELVDLVDRADQAAGRRRARLRGGHRQCPPPRRHRHSRAQARAHGRSGGSAGNRRHRAARCAG
jgi:non-ribosomal peptide synthetase component F